MSSGSGGGGPVPYLGSRISIISKSEIRYEGILYTVNTKESTISLAKVRSFGTEDRPTTHPIAAQEEVYEYIVFKASDIKDLAVCDSPKEVPQMAGGLPYDPAIVAASNQGGKGSAPTSRSTTPSNLLGPSSPPDWASRAPGAGRPLLSGGGRGHFDSTWSGGPLGAGGNGPVPLLSNNQGGGGSGPPPFLRPGLGRGQLAGTGRGMGGFGQGMQQAPTGPRGFNQQQPHQHNQAPQGGPRSYGQALRDGLGMDQQQQHGGYGGGYGGHGGGPPSYGGGGGFQRYGGNNNNYAQPPNSYPGGFANGGGGEYYNNRGGGMGRGGQRGGHMMGGGRGGGGMMRGRGGPGGRGMNRGRGGYYPGGAQEDRQKYDKDYDFEEANAKFIESLKDVEDRLLKAKIDKDPASDETKDTADGESGRSSASEGSSSSTAEADKENEFYDKTKSFFDTISCEATEKEERNAVQGGAGEGGRGRGRGMGQQRSQERRLNIETFGTPGVRRGGYYGGRGRGGYRGYRGGGFRR